VWWEPQKAGDWLNSLYLGSLLPVVIGLILQSSSPTSRVFVLFPFPPVPTWLLVLISIYFVNILGPHHHHKQTHIRCSAGCAVPRPQPPNCPYAPMHSIKWVSVGVCMCACVHVCVWVGSPLLTWELGTTFAYELADYVTEVASAPCCAFRTPFAYPSRPAIYTTDTPQKIIVVMIARLATCLRKYVLY